MTLANGDVYFGEWRNGNYNGKGILTESDGTIFKGLFQNGSFKHAFDVSEDDLLVEIYQKNDFI